MPGSETSTGYLEEFDENGNNTRVNIDPNF